MDGTLTAVVMAATAAMPAGQLRGTVTRIGSSTVTRIGSSTPIQRKS